MPDYKSLSHTRWDCKYHIVLALNGFRGATQIAPPEGL